MLYYNKTKYSKTETRFKSRIKELQLLRIVKTPKIHMKLDIPFAEWRVIRTCLEQDIVVTLETYKKIEKYAKKLFR
jgi:ribosomal protein S17